MKRFKSWRSYSQFESALKHKSRYIHTSEVQSFLEAVLETSKTRIENIPQKTTLWRAQLGHSWRFENEEIGEIPAPLEPERMCPKPGRAKEGRANPKGIPCLYLASNRETALAEVRPWVGSNVSVGQFRVVRELSILNFAAENKVSRFYLKEPSPEKREEAVWSEINKVFAKPINPSDDLADYIPTQVLSELFKSEGFDGIGYRSSLGDGYNIALFDINSAIIFNCFLFEVKKINFEFSETAYAYRLKKNYKKRKRKTLNKANSADTKNRAAN